MERTYYEIDEESAKIAHDMMSMREYSEGSVTRGYKRLVNTAYDLADQIAQERPREAGRGYRLADRYAKKMADWYNRDSRIGRMCPSVLIAGGAGIQTRRKEKQLAAWEKNHEQYQLIQGIITKLWGILNGKEIIKSNDERAVESLEEKLEDLTNLQERMKAANKALRRKDAEEGNDLLRELGYSEREIEKLREPDCFGIVGYAPFTLTNNNANIRRVEKRIETLKAVKEKGTSEQEYKTFKVVENTEAMRYQVLFEGKPDEEIRAVLKKNGFKWAPSQGAWQRQITGNGKYALDKVVQELKEREESEA